MLISAPMRESGILGGHDARRPLAPRLRGDDKLAIDSGGLETALETEVAAVAGESAARMNESLAIIANMSNSFEADRI